MKVIKIITHPYLIISSLFCIIIFGKGWAGFYLLYLLFGLPYGAIHSLLALCGIVLLLVGNQKYKRKKESVIECLMEIIGVFLLMLSVFLFFYNDKKNYNFPTFHELLSLIMLILFLIISFASIVNNVIAIYKISEKNSIRNINI